MNTTLLRLTLPVTSNTSIEFNNKASFLICMMKTVNVKQQLTNSPYEEQPTTDEVQI